jgi:hypothetical protein
MKVLITLMFLFCSISLFSQKQDSIISPKMVTDIEIDKGEGLVYPNPCYNLFNTSSKVSESKIYDYLGNIMLCTKSHVIDVSNFASGVYVLIMKVDKDLVLTKIMVI